MSTIVVGVDGTEASGRALRWAVHEAKLRGATLHVVHTWPAPYAVLGPNPRMRSKYTVDVADKEQRIAEEFVERELDEAGAYGVGIHIEREVVEAAPAPTLLAAAAGADLLVLGSSRHGPLADVVLGAVGEECVRHAPCPVVIVRSSRPPLSG